MVCVSIFFHRKNRKPNKGDKSKCEDPGSADWEYGPITLDLPCAPIIGDKITIPINLKKPVKFGKDSTTKCWLYDLVVTKRTFHLDDNESALYIDCEVDIDSFCNWSGHQSHLDGIPVATSDGSHWD